VCFDFVVRQKAGGTHLNFFIVERFPVLPPEAYTPADLLFIVPRVLELVYTAWDIKPFADDVWRETLIPNPSPSGGRGQEDCGQGGLKPSPAGRGQGEGQGEGFPRLPKELLKRARELRRNATDAEEILWRALRNRRLAGLKFRRQHPYHGYILDFYCHEHRLAIELDGGGHADPAQRAHDEHRSRVLAQEGIRVLRYWNNDVLQNLEGVLEDILAHIQPPSHSEGTLRQAIVRQWEENAAETGGHVGAQPPPWAESAPDGFPYPPFKWDEERRARLRAELDAIYARLYGLTRDELDYILDTFPIVRRKDEERWGEYRTKRLVLNCFDLFGGDLASAE